MEKKFSVKFKTNFEKNETMTMKDEANRVSVIKVENKIVLIFSKNANYILQ